MAIAMESNERSRFTDIFDEPVDRLLSPIRGYEDQPLFSLAEAITPVSHFFNDMEAYVYVALYNCQQPTDGLTQEESAAIHLYTMQFHGEKGLYILLNQALRAENRDELRPWFSFLKLFLTALHKLPSQSGTIWRGVKDIDFSFKYKTGTKFAWWGVSSCTTHIEVLESEEFLGKNGERTIFSIECINGKSISNHSYFKNKEKEVILIPGSFFEVIGQLNPSPQFHIIQLKEISPPVVLVKPPFYKPIQINPTSSTIEPSTFSQPLSKVELKPTNVEVAVTQMPLNTKIRWKQNGLTIAGGNGDGDELNQLSYPQGIFIDDNETIYIADSGNHRIIEWKSNKETGRIVAGGNGEGRYTNQLNYPTDVLVDKENNSLFIADRGNRRVMRWSCQKNTINGQIIIANIHCCGLTMDKNGSIYVSDWKNDHVSRWKKEERNGTIVAGGNGKGDQLNQLNNPTFIFVDENESLYVSDWNNHRVMKWLKDSKEGIIVAGGNGRGNSLKQLCRPEGVVVDQLGEIYVIDCENHRVMCWCEEDEEGSIVVGGNGQGKQSNQLYYPRGLSFDIEGNLYVVDFGNHRIEKFKMNLN